MKLCQNTVLMNEYLILTKFHNDWVKIVDFLIKAYFCLGPDSPIQVQTGGEKFLGFWRKGSTLCLNISHQKTEIFPSPESHLTAHYPNYYIIDRQLIIKCQLSSLIVV